MAVRRRLVAAKVTALIDRLLFATLLALWFLAWGLAGLTLDKKPPILRHNEQCRVR